MALDRRVPWSAAWRYRGGGPMRAWLLHRLTGFTLVVLVSVHILASLLMRQYGHPAGIRINAVFEHWAVQVIVVFCALFHGLNGLRIVVLDAWPALLEYQREAIWLVWAVFLPVFGIAAWAVVTSGGGG